MPIHLLPPWWRPCCSSRRSLQRLHQGLEAAQRLDLGLLLLREDAVGQRAQPFLGQLGDIDPLARLRQRFEPLEDAAEHAVEGVDLGLVLHQGGAGEVIERLDVVVREAVPHGLQQRQILAHRDGNAFPAKALEQRREHGSLPVCVPSLVPERALVSASPTHGLRAPAHGHGRCGSLFLEPAIAEARFGAGPVRRARPKSEACLARRSGPAQGFLQRWLAPGNRRHALCSLVKPERPPAPPPAPTCRPSARSWRSRP